jgi:RHS repeat-associated protein
MDANSNFSTHAINDVTRAYTTTLNTNQLASITTSDNSFNRAYTYTESGQTETIQDASNILMQFIYNKGNSLPQTIDLPGNTTNDTIAFTYSPDNTRVLKIASLAGQTVSQRLYIHGLAGKPTLEIDQSNSTEQVKRYIYIPGAAVIFYNNSYYLALKDHLGSTRAIMDQSANIIGQYNYDVYGSPTIIKAPDFAYDYLYTSQEYDTQTGLYNYKARLYDPIIGRFTMLDPAMQYFSPYVYAGNNPVIFVDPTGQMAGWIEGLLIGIAAVAVGVVLTWATGGTGTVGVMALIAGNILIGAGTSGIITSLTHTKKGAFSWSEYGVQAGIGAGIGLFTGGIAAAFAKAGQTAAQSAEQLGTRVAAAFEQGGSEAAEGNIISQAGRGAASEATSLLDQGGSTAAESEYGTWNPLQVGKKFVKNEVKNEVENQIAQLKQQLANQGARQEALLNHLKELFQDPAMGRAVSTAKKLCRVRRVIGPMGISLTVTVLSLKFYHGDMSYNK